MAPTIWCQGLSQVGFSNALVMIRLWWLYTERSWWQRSRFFVIFVIFQFQIIHLIRDPRAILSSIKDQVQVCILSSHCHKRWKSSNSSRLQLGYLSCWTQPLFVWTWKTTSKCRTGFLLKGNLTDHLSANDNHHLMTKSRYLRVRYEDILKRPLVEVDMHNAH